MPTSTQPVLLFLFTALLALSGCAQAQGETPTQEIVAEVLRKSWERAGPPKTTLELNSVKFGKPYKATVQEVQVEGLPEGGLVTPAIVDFTVRTFYDRETQLLRRVREARVYKNKFDEWAVMTGSVRGEDQRSTEPAAK
jgi:hypothetical protein